MDDALQTVFKAHGGADQLRNRQAADLTETQLTAFFDVGHHQSQGIHVGREHDLLAGALLVADEVAHHVGRDLVAVRLRHLRDDRRHRFLPSAGTEGRIHFI